MKAIGYIRVSTEEQVEGDSLDNQRARIEAYCNFKGFELVKIITDEGISGGKNKARPGFISLLDEIEKREIDILVLNSLERLSRDMLTLLSLEKFLNEYEIELHTPDGAINTASPDGFMNFAMKAFLGEMERRQIKHRTKKVMEFKKSKGEVVGSIPYGFTRINDTLIENLQEQEIIRKADELYQTGNRLVDIVNHLNGHGLLTRSGKKWSPQQIKNMITDYVNKKHANKTKLGETIRHFIQEIA